MTVGQKWVYSANPYDPFKEDIQCKNVLPCKANEFRIMKTKNGKAFSKDLSNRNPYSHGTACKKLTKCKSNQYESQAPNRVNGVFTSDRECRNKVCECPNGKAVSMNICRTNGTTQCDTCNDGYYKYYNQCLKCTDIPNREDGTIVKCYNSEDSQIYKDGGEEHGYCKSDYWRKTDFIRFKGDVHTCEPRTQTEECGWGKEEITPLTKTSDRECTALKAGYSSETGKCEDGYYKQNGKCYPCKHIPNKAATAIVTCSNHRGPLTLEGGCAEGYHQKGNKCLKCNLPLETLKTTKRDCKLKCIKNGKCEMIWFDDNGQPNAERQCKLSADKDNDHQNTTCGWPASGNNYYKLNRHSKKIWVHIQNVQFTEKGKGICRPSWEGQRIVDYQRDSKAMKFNSWEDQNDQGATDCKKKCRENNKGPFQCYGDWVGGTKQCYSDRTLTPKVKMTKQCYGSWDKDASLMTKKCYGSYDEDSPIGRHDESECEGGETMLRQLGPRCAPDDEKMLRQLHQRFRHMVR